MAACFRGSQQRPAGQGAGEGAGAGGGDAAEDVEMPQHPPGAAWRVPALMMATLMMIRSHRRWRPMTRKLPRPHLPPDPPAKAAVCPPREQACIVLVLGAALPQPDYGEDLTLLSS